ncbi:glycosyltransferase family 4 protein [Arthrobacter halodurans]|uniref:D-inositol 3-phosphate glycosyltransferase n=1 Tax=Arthrobacter halodurans TaxID=516699 RepID=A0ABV4UI23_9MICC
MTAAGTGVHVARNLRLTVSTALQHLTEDPTTFALQTARRLPRGLRDGAVAVVGRAVRRDDSVAGAVARIVGGDSDAAAQALERAAAGGIAPRRAARLADVATAAGAVDTAEALLRRAPAGDPRADIARARLAWHLGDMSGALRCLEGHGGAAARLRRRWESEARVFRGAVPRVDPRPDYRAEPGRVLHFVTNSLPHTGSGYAQRTHSILVALRAAGRAPLAVTRLGYPVQVGKPFAAAEDVVDGIRYLRLLPPRLDAGFESGLQQQTALLAAAVLEHRPAVLHTTTHFVNAVAVRAVAEAYGIPWVYEVRGQLADTWASTRPDAVRGSERYRLFREREAESARAADAVVTLGEAMRDQLVAQGVEAGRIVLCPNAVGEDFLKEPRGAADARKLAGLDAGHRYVGTVSSIVAYEGLDDLVAAFALLAPRHADLRLLLAGDGVALPALRRQAERLGVADRVVFAGRVPRERASIYHQALEVFVVPRKDLDVTRSVTPLKPVEAAASGRPVVASDLPALAELVRDGENGLLVAPGDPAALAAGIERLISDSALARRLGAAGRAWAVAERTWAANARKYSALYDRIAAAKAPPR